MQQKFRWQVSCTDLGTDIIETIGQVQRLVKVHQRLYLAFVGLDE